jgi:hypothetical protein
LYIIIIIVAYGVAGRPAQEFHLSKCLIRFLLAVDITPSRFEYTQQTNGARCSHDYAFLYSVEVGWHHGLKDGLKDAASGDKTKLI